MHSSKPHIEPAEVVEARELLKRMAEPLPVVDFTDAELRALLELPNVEGFFPSIKKGRAGKV
jgi:hypothetical protein